MNSANRWQHSSVGMSKVECVGGKGELREALSSVAPVALPSAFTRSESRHAGDTTRMASFLFYCKPENIGDPVDYLASDQLGRLRPSDEMWVVTFSNGNLVLQGHLQVASIEDRTGAERVLGHADLWDAKLYAIAESPAERRTDISITDVASELRFEGGVERLPEQWTAQSLQTMRRLADESAARLRGIWESRTGRRPARNPVWERDELILALDLYFRLDRKVPDDADPEVVALSELLNLLPIHSDPPDEQRFRNPNGVALKLANFRALEQPGHGMSRGGKRDRQVWDEFSGDPETLGRTANAIREGYGSPNAEPLRVLSEDDEEAEFPEGRILYRWHRARERNRSLIDKKKAQVRKAGRPLSCEACGFDFEMIYGPVGAGYIECHHASPLSEVVGITTTRIADLVLVCSNCHRMIHRKRPWLSVDAIRQLVRPSQ